MSGTSPVGPLGDAKFNACPSLPKPDESAMGPVDVSLRFQYPINPPGSGTLLSSSLMVTVAVVAAPRSAPETLVNMT